MIFIWLRKHRRFTQVMSMTVAFNLVFQLCLPSAFALTGGPSQPEFSSFEPVATTNLVNDFSGDFTYNLPVLQIPGPDGSAYAMSLSYHSGASPNDEASWVGYGWTLNPGAINRNVRGFPDDWKGEKITYHHKAPDNITVALSGGFSVEAFSIGGSWNGSMRLNSYTGFGTSSSFGVSFGGVVSLGYHYGDGDGSFSLSVNPAAALKSLSKKSKGKQKDGNTDKEPAKTKKLTKAQKKTRDKITSKTMGIANISLVGGNGLFTYGNAARPSVVSPYKGFSTTVSLELTGTIAPVQVGLGGSVSGQYNWQSQVNPDNGQFHTDETVYGYMYSSEAEGNRNAIMDYTVEKEQTFNKRDLNLSIPINNADVYSVTGEGLAGGFRMFSKEAGTFRPNYKKNLTISAEVGVDLDLGWNNGGGASLGASGHRLSVEKWETHGTHSFSNSLEKGENENVVFRFNNDLGGVLDRGAGSDNLQRASLYTVSGVGGSKSFKANVGGISNEIIEDAEHDRVGRASYIGFTLNEDLLDAGTVPHTAIRYKAYDKAAELVDSDLTANREAASGQIGEFAVTNETGLTYNYGLPVYAKNEREISVDVFEKTIQPDRYIVTGSENGSKAKVGEERNAPYASAYLLTSITTPDYVDRSHNGPSLDDFGGYTKFSYERVRGGNGSWYKWRLPYGGMIYQPNSLSDPKDDLASFQEGEKELYFLKQVETRTHYAKFITGDRKDGHQAQPNASQDANPAVSGSSAQKRLMRIELYAGHPDDNLPDELIRTVHFEYDYHLCQGTLNSEPGGLNGGGKLSLKRVWFEHGGVVHASVAPYEFQYSYPNVNYPSPYNNTAIDTHGSQFTSIQQNPNYSPQGLDAWGNYQVDGESRYQNMQRWVDQTPPATFDPAAWQLKAIKLPSGGEIHVQYEQADYSYVQDRPTHALVSLIANPIDLSNPPALGRRTFSLDVSDVIDPTDSAYQEKLDVIGQLIRQEYIIPRKRMFFKFLYRLNGFSNDAPQIDHCNADYISGYCRVRSVSTTGGQLTVELGADQGVSTYMLPRQVCLDFVETQRQGMLNSNPHCDPTGNTSIFGDPNDPGTGFENVFNYMASELLGGFSAAMHCIELNHELSYLRIPIVDKKGGGVRVKRLLMYDEGLEPIANSTDDAGRVLLGSEYIYRKYDESIGAWVSSGVATNEPGIIREENPLVTDLPRGQQSALDRIISGKDRDQMEGPIGESLLPGPSVGYSQVIVRNIHSGITNPGYSVREFYTAKDYPFDHEETEIEKRKDFMPLTLGVVNYIVNNIWLTQGYLFKLNQMHGKTKSSRSYAGDYSSVFANPDEPNPDAGTLISYEETEYFQPEDQVPVLTSLRELVNPEADLLRMSLGREMDITTESRVVRDLNDGGSLEFDADFGMFGMFPVPFASVFPSYSKSTAEMHQHVTSKVVWYPAIEKKKTVMRDGIVTSTENVAFDPRTGKPIVTRSYDGHHDMTLGNSQNPHQGYFTSYSVPGWQEYTNLDQKAWNEKRRVLSTPNLTIDLNIDNDNGPYLDLEGDVCDALDKFTIGDQLEVYDDAEVYGVFHIEDIWANRIELAPLSYDGMQADWASPTWNPHEWNWASFGGGVEEVDVQVLRSGRTNQLGTTVGSFTTYGEKETHVHLETLQEVDPLYSQKQQFVAELNAALVSGGTVDATGMELVGPDGVCFELQEPINVSSDGTEANIQMPVVNAPTTSSNFVVNGTFDGTCTITENQSCIAENNGYTEYIIDGSPNCIPSWGNIYEIEPYYIDPSEIWDTTHFFYYQEDSPDPRIVQTNNESVLYLTVDRIGLVYRVLNDSSGIFEYQSTVGVYQDFQSPLTSGNYSLMFDYAGENLNMQSLWVNLLNIQDTTHFEAYSQEQVEHITNSFLYEDSTSVFQGVFIMPLIPPYTSLSCSENLQFQQYSYQFTIPPALNGLLDRLTFTTNMDTSSGDGFFIDNVVLVKEGEDETGCNFNVSADAEFSLDPETGTLVLKPFAGACYTVPFDCFNFCDKAYPGIIVDDVVSSEATEYAHDWKQEINCELESTVGYWYPENRNDFEDSEKGKWRPSSQNVYRTGIESIDAPLTGLSTERSYNTGMYPLEVFNWKHPQGNNVDKWLQTSKVTRYSRHGNAEEEKDIMGIYSSAKFGYDRTLPYVIAKNAPYNSVYFESFEKSYSSRCAPNSNTINVLVEDEVLLDSDAGYLLTSWGHSGKGSLKLLSDGFDITGFEVSPQHQSVGSVCKLWVFTDRSISQVPVPSREDILDNLGIKVLDQTGTEVNDVGFEFVAEVGQWTLLKSYLDPMPMQSFAQGDQFSTLLYYTNIDPNSTAIIVDDIRIQPADASSNAYVYDPGSQRLVASLDDQNFALIYQYNDEGKLTRKMKETERGVRTLQETQYHTPRETSRPDVVP